MKKRIAAVKTADAINAIEGAPVSNYARVLSASWARGELTGSQMKKSSFRSPHAHCGTGTPQSCLIHIYMMMYLCFRISWV